jgi:hypothetical protein
MNKKELLRELSLKINTGEITQEELINKLNIPTLAQSSTSLQVKDSSHFSITGMLYVFGAAVAIIGLIIFIAQIWEDLGSMAHILITLGLGLLITLSGSILIKQKPKNNIGSIFHFIGGMLIPGGALVTLEELNITFDSAWPLAITFGIIFAFYLILNSAHKRAVLTFFSIANGTAFVYLLVGAIEDFRNVDLYMYLTMIIGVSYLLLAHSFRVGWNKKLLGLLYFFGTLGILGAGFIEVFDSGIWKLFYFIIVFTGLYLSVHMKSRIILALSTMFLIIHISYITGEYFANSFGWPISLILLGFMIIGLGYGSVHINKTYIKQT